MIEVEKYRAWEHQRESDGEKTRLDPLEPATELHPGNGMTSGRVKALSGQWNTLSNRVVPPEDPVP